MFEQPVSRIKCEHIYIMDLDSIYKTLIILHCVYFSVILFHVFVNIFSTVYVQNSLIFVCCITFKLENLMTVSPDYGVIQVSKEKI